MKKLFISTLFGLMGLVCNAQIYNQIKYFDKFDDELKVEQRKSLITKTDSTIIVEEKGKQPVVYHIINVVESATQGSKDNVVNLVDDVYGYETTWCVVPQQLYAKFYAALLKWVEDSSDENMQNLSSFWLFAVHRTVTTQYTGSYITDFFWLKDESNLDILGKSVQRIIYLNNK